jgi:hypothetical protein
MRDAVLACSGAELRAKSVEFWAAGFEPVLQAAQGRRLG